MSDVDITVIDANPDDNGYLSGARDKLDGEIPVYSVEDMVYKVEGRLRPQDCIRTLNIVGHGSAGTIVVGSSRSEAVRGKRINGNEGEWRDLLGRLSGSFCTGAKVRLLGCNTGVCDRGAAKLHKLATLWNVEVCGTRRTLYPGDFDANGVNDPAVLVCVQPGGAVPACMTQSTTEGLKQTAQPKSGAIEESRVAGFGLRDAQTGLGAATRPFRDRWVQYLLEHIDWSTPYDAQGLGATIEATIDLVYDDLTSETLGVTLDAHAVELVRHGAHYLYLVHPHADLGGFVEDLRRAQQPLDEITTKYLGESPAVPGRAPSKLLREALALELGEDLAGLAAADLLARPVLILPGIDQATADVLRETVGVVTVGDLAATGAKTTAAALARMIRDLDRS